MVTTAAKKEDADLSYEEAMQIAKDAGISSSDIARCQRLAALSQAEFDAYLERQIGTSTKKPRGLAKATEALREAILAAFEETEKPVTLRQMFYMLTVRGAVEKEETGYRSRSRRCWESEP